MEKENFIEVLKHYSESSEEEALNVLSLKESYPYSQLLHALSARVSKDHSFINHQKELQLAAVYAADRSVLKDVMTLNNLHATRPTTKAQPAKVEPKGTSPEGKSVSVDTAQKISQPVAVATASDGIDNVADQVLSDLEKLHQLKHNFEQMFVEGSGSGSVAPATEKNETVAHSEIKKEPSRDSGKSRKARIVELAKAMAAAREDAGAEEESAPKVKKKKEVPESFIEEIVSTKKELEPENDKQKEQLEIIEQFIKTQPSISNPKDKVLPPPGGDLSFIKTGEFNDNVVSETLVEILIKQGKKDKAIEVLKKLIWKFPQKKAYFAAQIEELKRG